MPLTLRSSELRHGYACFNHVKRWLVCYGRCSVIFLNACSAMVLVFVFKDALLPTCLAEWAKSKGVLYLPSRCLISLIPPPRCTSRPILIETCAPCFGYLWEWGTTRSFNSYWQCVFTGLFHVKQLLETHGIWFHSIIWLIRWPFIVLKLKLKSFRQYI